MIRQAPKTSRQLDAEIEQIDRENRREGQRSRAAAWKPAPRAEAAIPDPGLVITANRLLEAARHAHKDYWVGKRKVFLAAIVDVEDPVAMEILDECRRAGLLSFARADLVSAMDPDLVAASEWKLGGQSRGPTYHFIEVD